MNADGIHFYLLKTILVRIGVYVLLSHVAKVMLDSVGAVGIQEVFRSYTQELNLYEY